MGGYYTLQWRYDYLIDVIQSLQKGIDINRKVERYDKENDTYFLEEICAPIGSIIIVEGVFLQREEIRDIFDYIIYIDVPEEVRLGRVLKRDGYIGDKNQIKEKYDNRYFPAEHYYIKLCLPSKNADFIFAPEIKNYL